MRARNERIRLSGLVLIVAVLIVRLSYDATNRDIGIRSYALVNFAIVLGAAGIVALACTCLPRPGRPVVQRRLRIVARKRRDSGTHTIHLN
jgi:hypothetical protein